MTTLGLPYPDVLGVYLLALMWLWALPWYTLWLAIEDAA